LLRKSSDLSAHIRRPIVRCQGMSAACQDCITIDVLEYYSFRLPAGFPFLTPDQFEFQRFGDSFDHALPVSGSAPRIGGEYLPPIRAITNFQRSLPASCDSKRPEINKPHHKQSQPTISLFGADRRLALPHVGEVTFERSLTQNGLNGAQGCCDHLIRFCPRQAKWRCKAQNVALRHGARDHFALLQQRG